MKKKKQPKKKIESAKLRKWLKDKGRNSDVLSLSSPAVTREELLKLHGVTNG